ncbi:MAG: YicC family protein [Verrucomicrobia bacterium]|nr:YicC family protein [Verrucomicrobiota bacterium]MBV9657536.1 YicC family protein [Verrucomicrobiota bacterium]
MRSMTGYGGGRASDAALGWQCNVEISSVNRRQSELALNLPRELLALEPAIREAIQARVARGRLNVNIVCQRAVISPAPAVAASSSGSESVTPPTALAFDAETARAYHRALLALQRELGVAGEIGIDTILRAPGVLRAPAFFNNNGNTAAANADAASAASPLLTPDAAWPLVEAALRQALDALVAMREREGRHLADDLRGRSAALRAIVAEIRTHAPHVVENHRRALHERLAQSGVDFPPDDERLARELALFADRCDISEELTRLDGHFDQLDALLNKTEPVGRTLDFLGQELAREFNTLGAKANDLQVSRLAVAGKAELEKIREQVQNIE